MGRYWLAVFSALLGVALRLLIDPWIGDQSPYVTFLVSVAVTGLYAGVRPALLCAALGAVLAYFCFVPPRYHWGFATKSDVAGFLLYLAAALGVVLLTRARNKAYKEKERILEEQIHAERKLRDAQKLLRMFVENRPGCAYLRDDAGRYVYFNDDARSLLGITDGNRDRKSELRLKLESQDERALAAVDGAMQFVDKVSVRGEEQYWLTTKFIFANEDRQRFVGSLSVDITGQMRAEEIMVESERLASASQMVHMVAHEINNPLAAVTNLLFLLGRENLPHPAGELVEVAQHELARLNRITSMAMGVYTQTEVPVALDPARLVDDVLIRVTARYTGQGVQIERDFRWNGLFVACASQISKSLEHIVRNSLESGARRIRVRVARSSDWRLASRGGVRISILDDGRGMNPQQCRKAFDPFFSTKTEKGRGLGLWAAKAMALRNAGHITLRSTDHPSRHGTCVSIFLPYRHAAGPGMGAQELELPEGAVV